VNLYAAGTADIKLDDGRTVKLAQETRYPWDGVVKMTVTPAKSGKFNLNVRIPGWARDEALPSDLYAFADKVQESATLKVNGKTVPMKLEKGYVSLQRSWKKGDVVELNLPMTVRRIVANQNVADDVNNQTREFDELLSANGEGMRQLLHDAVTRADARRRVRAEMKAREKAATEGDYGHSKHTLVYQPEQYLI